MWGNSSITIQNEKSLLVDSQLQWSETAHQKKARPRLFLLVFIMHSFLHHGAKFYEAPPSPCSKSSQLRLKIRPLKASEALHIMWHKKLVHLQVELIKSSLQKRTWYLMLQAYLYLFLNGSMICSDYHWHVSGIHTIEAITGIRRICQTELAHTGVAIVSWKQPQRRVHRILTKLPHQFP